MPKPLALEPDYGNWVSKKFLYGPGILTILFLGLSLIFPWLAILAFVFFACFVYFAYAHYRFSSSGGNIQARIQDLVLEQLEWDGCGRVLDIGCGNGPLSIKLAKKFPEAGITAVDYWGGNWEYSKGVCDRNAEIEGVGGQIAFQKASASKLPFEDEFFDVAVSNLTFHEVSDARDKKDVIKEALRVVRKGGKFVFQDLFLMKAAYGEINEMLATIRSWGIDKVEFVDTSHLAFIPAGLKLPFMVGTIGILIGTK